MKPMRWFVTLAAMAATVAVAEGPQPFLFLKTGEKFATQETAGPTVSGLTAYLGDKLSGSTNAFAPRVLNDPVKAAELCAAQKPSLGIVTPGFYLTYAKPLGMEPLLETKREQVPSERYVLVVRTNAPVDLKSLEGKTIATVLAPEQRYVTAVILQGKLGAEPHLRTIPNIELALFSLADGAQGAPDAVLVDEPTWKLFQSDQEIGPGLKSVFQSDELPRDLVVVFHPNAGDLDTKKVTAILKSMGGQDPGQSILRSIRVESFEDINKERLAKARTQFQAP